MGGGGGGPDLSFLLYVFILYLVAGLNVWVSVLTIGIACTFYTTIVSIFIWVKKDKIVHFITLNYFLKDDAFYFM